MNTSSGMTLSELGFATLITVIFLKVSLSLE